MKKKKPQKAVKAKIKEILEFYYMIPGETNVKNLSGLIESIPEEQVEIWTELNLMEIVMTSDSLIFQDAWSCFEDPLDLAFFKEHEIGTIYHMSFEKDDLALVKTVMKELISKAGGFVASDSDDFLPIYTGDNIEKLG